MGGLDGHQYIYCQNIETHLLATLKKIEVIDCSICSRMYYRTGIIKKDMTHAFNYNQSLLFESCPWLRTVQIKEKNRILEYNSICRSCITPLTKIHVENLCTYPREINGRKKCAITDCHYQVMICYRHKHINQRIINTKACFFSLLQFPVNVD